MTHPSGAAPGSSHKFIKSNARTRTRTALIKKYCCLVFERIPCAICANVYTCKSHGLRILIKDGTCRVYVILWEGGSSWFKFHPPWNLVGK